MVARIFDLGLEGMLGRPTAPFQILRLCYNPSAMSGVFISYSRRDIAFVCHLFDQLTARDREPWVDWLAEIYRGIDAVGSFLLLSVQILWLLKSAP